MSTLSEIAVNHAKIALALESESVSLSPPCPPLTRVFDASPLLPAEQMPAHAIAAISANLSGQATAYPI